MIAKTNRKKVMKTMNNEYEWQPTAANRFHYGVSYSILLIALAVLAACAQPISNTKELQGALDRAKQAQGDPSNSSVEFPSEQIIEDDGAMTSTLEPENNE